jgi:hypothetical protein
MQIAWSLTAQGDKVDAFGVSGLNEKMKSSKSVAVPFNPPPELQTLLCRLSAATGMPAEEIASQAILCGVGALKAGEKLEPATPEQLEQLVARVEADFAAK